MTLRDGARAIVQSVRQDVAWGCHHLVVNSVAGSVVVPRVARIALYRLMGVRSETMAIYDGCIFVGPAEVTIGSWSFVNRDCYFEAVAPISIGVETAVAMQVAFVTSTHAFDADGRFSYEPTGLPISVGDRCWIGARATILPGVSIGDDVVVAAGAVVTKDCAPGGLYAGVPARRIRDVGAGPRVAPVAHEQRSSR